MEFGEPRLTREPSKPAVKAADRKARSRAEVVEAFRHDELRPLWLGRLAFLWIADQVDRTAELKALKMSLVDQHLVTAAGRLDAFICYYWIATVLGWDDAQQLRVSAIRELRRLFGRNAANGEWQIRRKLEANTRKLWARMVKSSLSAATVRAEVDRLRPRKTLKVDASAREFSSILKSVRRLPPTQENMARLDELIRLCEARKAVIGNSENGAELQKPAA